MQLMPRAAASPRVGVVIPIRSFTDAKARLADHLDAEARAAVMRSMAERVLAAAAPMPVLVVTSAPEVREWARPLGADVIDDPGSLNGAAAAGVAHLARLGFDRAVIAHADLPHARSLSAFVRDGARPIVALAPCHRDDGTNVLAVPTAVPFDFAYGEGSFRRHLGEARHRHLGTRVVRDPDLALDVDELADLALL
jgi:2-phospho-L-lactate/phosphoenolpyruvate guanylyltransferase